MEAQRWYPVPTEITGKILADFRGHRTSLWIPLTELYWKKITNIFRSLGTFSECFAHTYTFCLGKVIYSKFVNVLNTKNRSNDGRYALVALCTFCYNSLYNGMICTWFSIVGILFMPHFWADNLKAYSIFWKYYLNRSFNSQQGVSIFPLQEELHYSCKVYCN